MDASKVESSLVIIPDQLQFVSVKPSFVCPANTSTQLYFCTDETLIYTAFFADFGPLNLGLIYTFCKQLHELLNPSDGSRKMVVYYCAAHPHRRANSAVLLCAYMIFVLNYSAERAYAPFIGIEPPLYPFRDAGFCINTFPITVLDCVRGMRRAVARGHFVYSEFDLNAFQRLAKLQHGDISWIVPGKFIAFSGPVAKKRQISEGVWTLAPAEYVPLFRELNVTCIVRFNSKCYDRTVYTTAGIRHVDLYYEDGGNPTDAILQAFLQLCEHEKGAIAVHCKAGLGRTGTNIAAYMIKHYGYTAREAIAWHRICRPGSVVGPQQHYLCSKEEQLRSEGQTYRLRHNIRDAVEIPPHMFSRGTGAVTPPLTVAAREASGSNLFKPLFRQNSGSNQFLTQPSAAAASQNGSGVSGSVGRTRESDSNGGGSGSLYSTGGVRRPNTSGGALQQSEPEKTRTIRDAANDSLSQSMSNMRLRADQSASNAGATSGSTSRPQSGTRRSSIEEKKSRKFAFSDANPAASTGTVAVSGGSRSGSANRERSGSVSSASGLRNSVDGALRSSTESVGKPPAGAYTDAGPRPHTSDVAGMRGVSRTAENSGGYAELRNSYGNGILTNGVASGAHGTTNSASNGGSGTASPPRYPITSAARVGGAPAKPQTSGYVSPYFSSEASRNSNSAVKSTGLYRPNTTSSSTRNRPVGAAGRYG